MGSVSLFLCGLYKMKKRLKTQVEKSFVGSELFQQTHMSINQFFRIVKDEAKLTEAP